MKLCRQLSPSAKMLELPENNQILFSYETATAIHCFDLRPNADKKKLFFINRDATRGSTTGKHINQFLAIWDVTRKPADKDWIVYLNEAEFLSLIAAVMADLYNPEKIPKYKH